MTIETKTFVGRVVDGYGGEFEQAIVVIHSFSDSIQRVGVGILGSTYRIEARIDRIAYEVSYYYSKETMDAGKKLRPLEVEEDGGFTRTLVVDQSTAQVQQILKENNNSDEKMLKAIQADFKERMKADA